MFKWLTRLLTKRMGGLYLRALGGGTPGMWASDHRKESEQFHHWNGVAIHQICLQAMQADVMVYRDASPAITRKRRSKAYTTQDESQEMPEDDPLVKLLKRPNKWESGGRFRYKCVQQLQLTGKCIIWNVPNVGGKLDTSYRRTAMRLVVPTAIASPVQPSKELPFGGWRIQPTWSQWSSDEDGFVEMFGGLTHAFGKVVPYEQTQVIDWPHPLYVDDGCSPTSRGARWIDGDTQVGTAQWAQLKNGADPSIHIEVPTDAQFDPELADRYAEKMAQKYGGPQNVGKVLFTQGGSVTPLSTTPKDMAYGEAFQQYRDAIMALHGAPKIDADTYASYYAKLKQFTEMTVQPILSLLAEEDTERLAPEFGEGLTIEMTAKTINDPEIMDRETNTLVTSRVIRVDEVRTRYGLEPLGGKEGEAFAGQAPATSMNVNGSLGLSGQGGFGLMLPAGEKPQEQTAPELSLPSTSNLGSSQPRFSLNGKHHTNGHRKVLEGYP